MIKILSRPTTISTADLELNQAYLKTVLANKSLGFLHLPERHQLNESCVKAAAKLRSKSKRIFFFGIGGSSLGPQVLVDVYAKPHEVMICDNLDPHFLRRNLGEPKTWSDCGFVFVSKSGGTLETLSALQYVYDSLKVIDPSWTERALVISENKSSSLTDWAKSNNVDQVEIPLDVGGRFSILSPVGMVLAEWLGQKASDFHAGASWALKQEGLIAELAAQSLTSFKRDEWITQFWVYSSSLRNLSAWTVQLWAESLAKAKGRSKSPPSRVSTPQMATGANDQHSILQQVMEGARDKFVIIQRLKSFGPDIQLSQSALFKAYPEIDGKTLGSILNIEAVATAEALRQSGVSVLEIELQDLSAKTVGAVLMTWMLVVAVLGEGLDINAFDQPGVELGKRLAKEILKNGVLPEL